MKKYGFFPADAAWLRLKSWGRLGLLLLSAGALAACAAGSRGVELSPQGPAMDLARGLYERGLDLPSLAARAGVGYTAQGQRHFFRVEMAAARDGRLLFTALDPTGRPAFRLASDGQTLTGLDYGSRQYFQGPATAANFARFIPLGLSIKELVALMSGAQAKPAAAGASERGGALELTVVPEGSAEGPDSVWRLKLKGSVAQNPASAVVESAVLGPRNRPRVQIRYMSYRELEREDRPGLLQPFPHSVEAQWNDGEPRSLRVTYDELRLGPALAESLFSVERPEGFELVELY